jgi:hypothetical protein
VKQAARDAFGRSPKKLVRSLNFYGGRHCLADNLFRNNLLQFLKGPLSRAESESSIVIFMCEND